MYTHLVFALLYFLEKHRIILGCWVRAFYENSDHTFSIDIMERR